MAQSSGTEVFDLLILTDATASMGSFLTALRTSLPEIIRVSILTDAFQRIGVLAYRDYGGGQLTEWSGWFSRERGQDTVSQEEILDFTKRLIARAGGDWPEATKTGLAKSWEVMREDARTLILIFADAPPHMPCMVTENLRLEKAALAKADSYGGAGPKFNDWVVGAKLLAQGDKKATVFSILYSHLVDTLAPYLYLGRLTGGAAFRLETNHANAISQLTMSLLLAWMGAAKAGVDDNMKNLALAMQYVTEDGIHQLETEDDEEVSPFFLRRDTTAQNKITKGNMASTPVDAASLPQYFAMRTPPVQDFSKRYAADEGYRNVVTKQLDHIITENISAMSINPVFGTLWRAVCNDRGNESRDELVALFSRMIEKITGTGERAKMKAWLEESYNYMAEIEGTISNVSPGDKFPCVFLDPTLAFEGMREGEEAPSSGSTDKLPPFTRDELLELGRSCDPRILKRIGKILTRLTYAEKEGDIPQHIKDAADQVVRIPMSLALPKYNKMFWRVLLHAVVPGTLLSARAGTLLAALSLRMGMAPLTEAADRQLLAARATWNTLDIPENWNLNCLSLLLDADKNYEARVRDGATVRPTEDASVLTTNDRQLFRTLIEYKLLELNLNTTLTARVGWTPEKNRVALGPVVVCGDCNLPRSVTMMGKGGICGHCTNNRANHDTCACAACDVVDAEGLRAEVSAADNEKTEKAWVECNVRECRGQYVVYNVEQLRVRPKCYYCRHADSKSGLQPGKAPFVECSQCFNRVIWPQEYRPAEMDLKGWKCPGCETKVNTIITVDTTARALMTENDRSSFLRVEEDAIKEPFNGRSLFNTVSKADLEKVTDGVSILPLRGDEAAKLILHGKIIHNPAALFDSLHKWVATRRVETGECSICFSQFNKRLIRPACGRRGCYQNLCSGCLDDWYGINSPGRIINTAALSCPFCRRLPSPKTLSSFKLRDLCGIKDAVDNSGSWIYAWCSSCSHAKQFVERVCAQGAPPELAGWRCEPCSVDQAKVFRHCPGCETPTERIDGCGHITCTIPGCGVHWCWFCGEKKEPEEVYGHMQDAHGGLYGHEDEEDSDDDSVVGF